MKNEFKVQSILEKVEILEVNVQDGNCLTDCGCWIWIGNKSSMTKGCYKDKLIDAYTSVKL
ncbi:TPA: hypothetical protein KNH21_002327 [Clostridioides difficile]|nr:hypothetical protein [Clostridioides difficile]HBE9109040.1 hypothetical protein [Clostridioides difficile]HBH3576434.1 hypothetical protein [Clostridioides difficile]